MDAEKRAAQQVSSTRREQDNSAIRHTVALIAAWVSVVAFLALAISVGNYNVALATVVQADILALVLLIIATAVHLLKRGEA